MRSTAVWLCLPALTAGCYLSPDQSAVTTTEEAGVMLLDAGSIAPPMDAGLPVIRDTGVPDTGPVDAGCSNTQLCGSSAPVCAAGSCGICKQDQDCTRFASTPACGVSGACATCSPTQKTLCTGATPACDPATNGCVACVTDVDCPSEARAACGTDRTCGLCTEDADCSRFGKVCDTRVGACVQCRPETEEVDCRTDKACDPKTTACAGTACDPKAFTCTTKARGSVLTCLPCVSDSECTASHRCVPLRFGPEASATELGGYCMKQTSASCARPFGTPITRVSLSGAPAETYCGFSEAHTSCEALDALDKNKTCTGASDNCGVSGGRCATVNFVMNSCTYSCGSALDCPASIPCGGPAADRICGGN